ncbi:hypothetical protein PCE1_003457 [Barthelona sp. PCE]
MDLFRHTSNIVRSVIKYTKDHERINIEGNKGVLSLAKYAAEHLGELVYVDAPEVGDEFSVSDEVLAVESVKAASSVYAPVTGSVLKVNESLEEDPGLAGTDPYGAGWLVEIEIKNAAELDNLMDEAQYAEFLKHCAH